MWIDLAYTRDRLLSPRECRLLCPGAFSSTGSSRCVSEETPPHLPSVNPSHDLDSLDVDHVPCKRPRLDNHVHGATGSSDPEATWSRPVTCTVTLRKKMNRKRPSTQGVGPPGKGTATSPLPPSQQSIRGYVSEGPHGQCGRGLAGPLASSNSVLQPQEEWQPSNTMTTARLPPPVKHNSRWREVPLPPRGRERPCWELWMNLSCGPVTFHSAVWPTLASLLSVGPGRPLRCTVLLSSNVGTCCPYFLGWLAGRWEREGLDVRPCCPCFLGWWSGVGWD